MKIAIITGITGGMDEFKAFPLQIVDGEHQATYIRLTDKDVPEQYKGLNKRTQALYFKQQMHTYMAGYDLYIWIDGKVQINRADFVRQCLDAIQGHDLAILKHGSRSCVYDEVDYIMDQIDKGSEYLAARYSGRRLYSQTDFMQRMNYPKNAGLNDCSIFIVRGGLGMQAIFNRWWGKCSDQMAFDQIWIRYFMWQEHQKIKSVEFTPGTFYLVKHKKVQ